MRSLSFRSRLVPLTLPIQFIHHRHAASAVPSVQLRDYQEHCIEACLSALNRGVSRIGVSMPTGSGKTTVFVSLLHKLPSRPNANKSLIIVNSIELALQAAKQVRRMFPDMTVEIEQGKNSATGLADV
jgi:ATP-dependent helicase IRC3